MTRDIKCIAVAVKGDTVSCRIPGKQRVVTIRPAGLSDVAPGIWDPKDHYWGEPGEPIEDWAKPVMSQGPRPEYEMEQVLPGQNPDDPDTDPILDANELREAGDYLGEHRMLMTLVAADLSCLDLHARLGNFMFDHSARGRFGMTATCVARNT